MLSSSLVLLISLVLFAQGVSTSDTTSSTQKGDTTQTLLLTQPEGSELTAEIEVLDKDTKEKFNRRYQVGGAIAVMAFVGILIGSVSSLNPK